MVLQSRYSKITTPVLGARSFFLYVVRDMEGILPRERLFQLRRLYLSHSFCFLAEGAHTRVFLRVAV